MITREAIRELAEYESPHGCALTFYYQPTAPKDQSHREEAIVLKDVVRGAMREAEKQGRNECARADLKRILEMADKIQKNGGKAKAIFADSSTGFWREFDLPAKLEGTKLIVNRRFHLKHMAPVLEWKPRVMACLVDRSRARLFRYENDTVEEVVGFHHELPRLGESDGFLGYDAGHNERHVAEAAKQHYKAVADALRKMYERDAWESLAVGCREETWPEFEGVMHRYLLENLLGRFRIDPVAANGDAVRDGIRKLLREQETMRRDDLVREVIGEAHRNGRGAIGLRRVLRSLENGEVQTLLIGDRFDAPGTQCGNCRHVDLKMSAICAACGQKTVEMDDIADAIIGNALKNSIGVVYVKGDVKLEKAGNIAALLRFRADQNTAVRQAS